MWVWRWQGCATTRTGARRPCHPPARPRPTQTSSPGSVGVTITTKPHSNTEQRSPPNPPTLPPCPPRFPSPSLHACGPTKPRSCCLATKRSCQVPAAVPTLHLPETTSSPLSLFHLRWVAETPLPTAADTGKRGKIIHVNSPNFSEGWKRRGGGGGTCGLPDCPVNLRTGVSGNLIVCRVPHARWLMRIDNEPG